MEAEFSKKTQIDVVILVISIATALSLLQFPYRRVDGNPVPTIIFNDSNPSLFHAFVLSLNFAFFGSFNSLILRRGYPGLAKNFLLLALLSIATGAAILIWLTLPICFSFARKAVSL